MDATRLLVALTGAVPAVAAMWVVDRLDRKRPEPARLRHLIAFLGMLSVIPALILELGVTSMFGDDLQPLDLTYQGATFKSFMVAAGVEEFCKIGVVYWIVWRHPAFDERMDGIVYASRAGLGFALVENVMYLSLVATSLEDQLTMWLLRALLAIPGHAMWTGMIGAMAARRRFDFKGLGLLGGYLLAVALHGTYDLALFSQQPLELEGHGDLAKLLVIVPIAITIASFYILRSMARSALVLDDEDAARAAAAAATHIAPVPSA